MARFVAIFSFLFLSAFTFFGFSDQRSTTSEIVGGTTGGNGQFPYQGSQGEFPWQLSY